jgi:hypothetical protein
MPEDQAKLTKEGTEAPADLLEMAARFRQHARLFVNDPMGLHLERYADELEARANQIIKQQKRKQ